MGKDFFKVLMIGFLSLSFLIPPLAFGQEKELIKIGFIKLARKPRAFKPGDEWPPGAKRRHFRSLILDTPGFRPE